MRKRQIHPAILIKVKRHHAYCRRQILLAEIDAGKWREFSFARIQIDCSARRSARQNEINGTIVIEICGDYARASGGNAERSFLGNIRESTVPVISPEDIVSGTSQRRRDVQI